MEAVQQFPGDGHGFVPQFSRDMLLPLMSTDAPSTPGRLDGRHHDSVVAPSADEVLSRVVPLARENDHGQFLMEAEHTLEAIQFHSMMLME